MSRLLGFFAVAACGRLGFEPPATRTDATSGDVTPVDAPLDASIDAPLDAPTMIIAIDPGPRHLGDTDGGTPTMPNGTTFNRSFQVSVPCSSALLELTFVPPWGPNVAQPPVVEVNGMAVGSVIPFFQNCAGDCDDFSGGDVHVVLPATSALVLGQNSFRITCGIAGDDFFFRDVTMSCVP